jgi:hypothetical protein
MSFLFFPIRLPEVHVHRSLRHRVVNIACYLPSVSARERGSLGPEDRA